MPTYLAITIAVASGLVAMGTVWRMLIKPMAELIVLEQKLLPLLKDQVRVLGMIPQVWEVVAEIVEQVRTNAGSSMKDILNRLDDSSKANARAADVLKVEVEASRQLAVADREQLSRLLQTLDRLTVKVNAGDVQRDRMEAATATVAADLQGSHDRADAVDGAAGEASDAASRSPKNPQ